MPIKLFHIPDVMTGSVWWISNSKGCKNSKDQTTFLLEISFPSHHCRHQSWDIYARILNYMVFHTNYPLFTWSFKAICKSIFLVSLYVVFMYQQTCSTCLGDNASSFSTESRQFMEQSLGFELHQPSSPICTHFELGDRIYFAYLISKSPKHPTRSKQSQLSPTQVQEYLPVGAISKPNYCLPEWAAREFFKEKITHELI